MLADVTVAEVVSAREIARAAGVRHEIVDELVRSGSLETIDGHYIRFAVAVAAVRRLAGGGAGAPAAFRPVRAGYQPRGPAMTASVMTHAAAVAAVALLTAGTARETHSPLPEPERARLVFVAAPGPGGGGGGGGLQQPKPPAHAARAGRAAVRSPVPPARAVVEPRAVARRATPPPPVRPRPIDRPVEPPAVTTPLPQVVAPVAAVAADPRDRAGVITEAPGDRSGQGPGTGGGAGTGQGAGIGEGEGPGLGPGTGGGTGGGPYRAGSGISPPSVLREVKPDYTEEARRRGITGDVVLEIVVRADGSVGPVRLLQGLGAGLDQRAIEAVKQWRFSPARRQGTPVDVLVEIAVEFRLR